MKHLKTYLATSVAALILFPSAIFAGSKDYGTAKNIIVMVPDGMSVEALTTARWMTEEKSFVLDSMATGLVRTNNSNTPIADSAPAGTAMATGVKTQSPFIATYPEQSGMPGSEPVEKERAKMPIATVLEGAKSLGKSTGLVVTSNVQHATPADFSAHHPDRNNYEALGEQQVYQNIDVVLGAGSKYLEGSSRADGEDLIPVLKQKGYQYLTTRQELLQAKNEKMWGLFAPKELSYDMDRDPSKEPSLSEMTSKALDVLSKNEKGFFLMVEGSQIDWAAHANDPVALVGDIKAFDQAVKVCKDFADTHGDTVLIIAADHGTGGITFGERAITKGYDKAPLQEFTHIITQAKKTELAASKELNETKSNGAEVMKQNFGISDLTPEEIQKIQEDKDSAAAIGQIVSRRSHIGWTTGGHVGGDVALYCYSTDKNAQILSGTVHNKDIGKYVEDLLNVNLQNLTDRYFIKARPALEAKGAKVEFSFGSKSNPQLIVTKGDQKIILPMYKNIAIVNGKEVTLEAVTVFNGSSCYISQSAIDLIQ